jgi:hypothetical protein
VRCVGGGSRTIYPQHHSAFPESIDPLVVAVLQQRSPIIVKSAGKDTGYFQITADEQRAIAVPVGARYYPFSSAKEQVWTVKDYALKKATIDPLQPAHCTQFNQPETVCAFYFSTAALANQYAVQLRSADNSELPTFNNLPNPNLVVIFPNPNYPPNPESYQPFIEDLVAGGAHVIVYESKCAHVVSYGPGLIFHCS